MICTPTREPAKLPSPLPHPSPAPRAAARAAAIIITTARHFFKDGYLSTSLLFRETFFRFFRFREWWMESQSIVGVSRLRYRGRGEYFCAVWHLGWRFWSKIPLVSLNKHYYNARPPRSSTCGGNFSDVITCQPHSLAFLSKELAINIRSWWQESVECYEKLTLFSFEIVHIRILVTR